MIVTSNVTFDYNHKEWKDCHQVVITIEEGNFKASFRAYPRSSDPYDVNKYIIYDSVPWYSLFQEQLLQVKNEELKMFHYDGSSELNIVDHFKLRKIRNGWSYLLKARKPAIEIKCDDSIIDKLYNAFNDCNIRFKNMSDTTFAPFNKRYEYEHAQLQRLLQQDISELINDSDDNKKVVQGFLHRTIDTHYDRSDGNTPLLLHQIIYTSPIFNSKELVTQ